jgi:DNA-binding SARP family transcriptional activator
LALLAFLALEPGPHSREELTALLWGESPEEKASASFRQALSQLRASVGDQLRIDRVTVELDPAVRSDVGRFLRAAPEDETALAIDIPNFLAGFHLKHCPAFDDWLDTTRQKLSARYRKAISSCAHAAAARRDWRRAATLAEAWLRVAPTSDDATHLLVEAKYLLGDAAAALAIFADYRQRLEAAENRSPHLALRELAKRIESGQPRVPTPDQNDDWHQAAIGFVAGLTGRQREWDAMTKAWSEIQDGRSRIVMLEGEAGVGKTRLADDFCRWITARAGTVLRGQAFEDALAVPFSPILDLLRAALRVPGVSGTDPAWLAEVSRILPDVRRQFPTVPAPSAATGGSVLFDAVSEVLLSAALDRPVAIVIDDLHWCDQDSCTMLHHLVRRLGESSILWLCTVTLGGLDRAAPASRLVRALRASPATTTLHLAPLTTDDVWVMIRELGRVSAASSGQRFAARVHEVTGGNPFYLIELLKTLLAQGWLVVHPETGEWIVPQRTEGELDVGTMSPTVQEAIAQRIARLPDDLHAILMSIALSRRGCRTGLLSHIHGISRLRAAAIADALGDRYLAVEDNGCYRCSHPVIASVVRAELSTARRREIHRALALGMIAAAEAGGEEPDPGEVAHHAEQGGELKIAYQYALDASRASQNRAAFEEALSWLDLASSCAAGPDQTGLVDRATAALLEAAGWPELPSAPRRSGALAGISRGDFDLRGE